MAGNIYHSWNGTVLTITSDSGTSSAELRGEDGCRGAQGIPGGTLYSVSQAATNLLDNSYFINPINQRGFTSGDTVKGWSYFIDRWCNYTDTNGTVSFSNNGMTYNFSMYQHLNPDTVKAGKVMTAAVKWADGTIQVATGTITRGNSWAWFHSGDNNGRLVGIIDDGSGRNSIRIDNDNGDTLVWAALYEGEYTTETLPAYQYKGYAAELLECQRYYENSWFGSSKALMREYVGMNVSSTLGDCVIEYRMPKRVAATVSFYPIGSETAWQIYNENHYREVDVAAQNRDGVNAFMVRYTKTEADTSNWNSKEVVPIRGHWEASADL